MGDLNNINIFLDKFKNFLFKKEETKSVIIKIISEEISYPVVGNMIVIKNGFVFVKGSPALRNEVILRKEKILMRIKKEITNESFFDIK